MGGLKVQKYLMSSWLYYVKDESVLTDEEYDQLCVELIDTYDLIDHPHKYLIDIEALKAGTGFHIAKDKYPTIVKFGAISWWENHHQRQWMKGD